MYSGAIRFAAPPPCLLAMLPFALVPETVAVVAMIGLGFVGHRVGAPAARDAALVARLPALHRRPVQRQPARPAAPAAGRRARRPIAVLVKIYAVLVPLLLGQWQAVARPRSSCSSRSRSCRGPTYIAEFSSISAALVEQSDGGMSALAIPVLDPRRGHRPGAHGPPSRRLVGRPRPWPSTQWYYTSLAMPATTLLAAFVVAVPVPFAATLGAVLVAAEVVWRSRRAPPSDAVPAPPVAPAASA